MPTAMDAHLSDLSHFIAFEVNIVTHLPKTKLTRGPISTQGLLRSLAGGQSQLRICLAPRSPDLLGNLFRGMVYVSMYDMSPAHHRKTNSTFL